MRNTRPLWYSVVLVAVLVIGSLIGFSTDVLKPTLGLDLEGGLSVILAAPEGTPRDVLDQALENIRNRVDAFGVGEPQIFVTGNNIEIQLPGLAPGTIQTSPKAQFCLETDGTSHGCAPDKATADEALSELVVTPQPKTVCIVDGDGELLDPDALCFESKPLADSALQAITVAPKPAPSVSPTPSPSASPSASPSSSPEKPDQCLIFEGKTYGCFPTQKAANDAKDALKTKTTENTYCVTAPDTTTPGPSATPTPSATPSKGGGSSSPSASASPSASPTPTATALLALSTDDNPTPFPCDFATQNQADTALAAITITHETEHFCVIGSSGKNLGCYLTREEADARQKETGQQHLLDIIGQTARLEERRVQAIITSTDPAFASTPLTCSTAVEQATAACSFEKLATQDVVYLGTDSASGLPVKYQLDPVVISGSDIGKATAVLQQATSQSFSSGWGVDFQLKGDGVSRFGALTTQLAALTPGDPTKQIAIAVDREIISSPQVTGAITGGSGQITGSFTETEAKDLATQLNSGALPVELTRQSVQTVSPTLGEESLHQGIVAGIVGLVALFLYLLFYYRLLGVVAWLGMSIWAILAFAMVSIAGSEFGYSLTLAGVAGLVISLGVTADSYIVFFERLKDEVRNGKTPRSAVQPAFKRAYRTIVAADFVTGIAAVVLYLTAVSSVKGFALTLGVATALDLFVVYFFKRPTVFLIARNEKLVNLHGFGLTSGVAGEAEPGEPLPVAGGSQ